MAPTGHAPRLSSALASHLSAPPDLWLVSAEGAHLPTHRALLALHSPALALLLSSSPDASSLSLPFPCLPLSLLLSLLATGQATHHTVFSPLEVLEVAELLGMDIDIHVDSNAEVEENSHETEEATAKMEAVAKMEVVLKEEPNESLSELFITRESDGQFMCNSCDFSTAKKVEMRNHKKMLHENSIFSCSGCDYKTKVKSHLKSHYEAKHAGVRFDCKFCDHQTAYKKALTRHIILRHSNGKTLSCTLCSFTSFDKKDLGRHIRTTHGINKNVHQRMALKEFGAGKQGTEQEEKPQLDSSLEPQVDAQEPLVEPEMEQVAFNVI